MRKSFVPICSIAVVLCFCCASFWGLDFQDEGFALNSLRYPYAYPGLFTRYAYVYQYLYDFAWQSIPIVRLLNIFVFLLVSMGLFSAPYLFAPYRQYLLSRVSVLPLSIGTPFVFSCLSLLAIWPFLTPSYGHAAFIGCLLVCYPVLLASRESPRRLLRLFSSLAGAFGIYLLLLAKLPTAVVVISLLAGFALFNGFRSWYIAFSIILGITFWFLHCSLVFHSPLLFVNDIKASFTILSHYQSRAYSPIDLALRLVPGAVNIVGFFISLLFVFILWNCRRLMSFFSLTKIRTHALFLSTALSLALIIGSADFQLTWSSFNLLFPRLLYSAVFFAFFSLYLISFVQYWRRCSLLPSDSSDLVNSYPFYFQDLRLALCKSGFLGAMSVAYALVTTNSFYEYISQSSIFFVLAIFSFLFSAPRGVSSALRPLTISYQLVPLVLSVVFVSSYVLFPFGHKVFLEPPAVLIYPGEAFAPLLISKSISSKLRVVKKKLELEGFLPGTPMLDLTSLSPGFQHFLGAKPVGWPWILGYAPGATDVAAEILRRTDTLEISSAWIIVENKESARKSNSNLDGTKLLNDLEINIEDPLSYKKVATVRLNDSSNNERMLSIYKPIK